MLKTALKKAMWVTRGLLWLGRGTATVLGLAVMLALVVGIASTALAANGQPFLLGKLTNSATAVTRLVGNVAGGPAMQIFNTTTTNGSRGLDLVVAKDHPPLTVNAAAGKATNLNADKVDGESFTCPTGKLLHEGVCIGTTKHTPTSFFTAEDICLSERSRLPTVAELQTFRNRAGTDFTSSTNELSNELDLTGTATYVHVIGPNGTRYFAPTSGASAVFPYRCVAATTP